jgi:hypothetical protein
MTFWTRNANLDVILKDEATGTVPGRQFDYPLTCLCVR